MQLFTDHISDVNLYSQSRNTKKPPELHENILMAVVTPAKEMKSNSKLTTLSFLYTQTINSPSCSLAWWWHINFMEREQKTEENKLFLEGCQRCRFADQRCGLVSPKCQIITLHKGCSSSCRLELSGQKLFMIPGTAEVLQDLSAA